LEKTTHGLGTIIVEALAKQLGARVEIVRNLLRHDSVDHPWNVRLRLAAPDWRRKALAGEIKRRLRLFDCVVFVHDSLSTHPPVLHSNRSRTPYVIHELKKRPSN
jgi:hypothetical protein